MPNTPIIYARKPHRKSRSGCQQCKQRKVKCDELKPSCSHCRRLQTQCSFSNAPSNTSPPYTQQSDTDNDLIASLNLSEKSPSAPRVGLEVNDLELLHFYTTETSYTLSNNPELQQIWQQIVPRIAFNQPFLLHGILAFSALHLARTEPKRQATLYANAAAHHNIALTMFRTAMSNITPQNCDACLAFSTIVAAYSWASSHQTGDLFFSDSSRTEDQSTVEWASLLRGVNTLLETSQDWIASSSMDLILHPRPTHPSPMIEDLEAEEKLAALSQLWMSAPGNFSAGEVEALNQALALVHEDYALMAASDELSPVDIVSVVYGWPIKVSGEFLGMVKESRVEALIVLAHYALLLNKAEHMWFMQGMGRRLLQTVHGKIGKEWEGWIAWPLQDLVLTEFNDQGRGRGVHPNWAVSPNLI